MDWIELLVVSDPATPVGEEWLETDGDVVDVDVDGEAVSTLGCSIEGSAVDVGNVMFVSGSISLYIRIR